MLPQGAEQGTAQAQAKQHEETGEVVDAHLQGLQRWDTGTGPSWSWPTLGEPWPGGHRLARDGPGAVQLDWEARAPYSGARFLGGEGTGAGIL